MVGHSSHLTCTFSWNQPRRHTAILFQHNCCEYWEPAVFCWGFLLLYSPRYTGQEAIVRTGYGTTDWFKIGKGVYPGCILSPCLFNLYAEYIMWNAGLDEAQAGIKIVRRNINNLRYADDITLMAESKELKNLWWKWKRRVKKLT